MELLKPNKKRSLIGRRENNMKAFLILLYGYLTLYWGYNYLKFCQGKSLYSYTMGLAIFLVMFTFLVATVDQIKNH